MTIEELKAEFDPYPTAACDYCGNVGAWHADGDLLCRDCLQTMYEEDLDASEE